MAVGDLIFLFPDWPFFAHLLFELIVVRFDLVIGSVIQNFSGFGRILNIQTNPKTYTGTE